MSKTIYNGKQIESGEIWKDIPDYEEIYQISNFGRIKSLKRIIKNSEKSTRIQDERMLKVRFDSAGGYVLVNLYKNSKGKTYTVHRLVAITFLPNPENKEQVNHIDGNKNNNKLFNLEWNTRKENIRHGFDTGLIISCKGENKSNSKLTEANVLKILNDSRVAKEIAKDFGVSRQTINDIKNRKLWKHITH